MADDPKVVEKQLGEADSRGGKEVVPPVPSAGTPANPEDAKQELRLELIKHLSSEIATEAEYLASLRSRMAFTFLTGPFIVMGSLLVTFNGAFVFNAFRQAKKAGWILAGCYLVMAFYAAYLDHHSSNLCNKWRTAIVSLVNGDKAEDFAVKQYEFIGYPVGFVIVMALVYALAFFIMQVVPPASAPIYGHTGFFH